MTSAAEKSRIRFIEASYIHVQSLRLASGEEALVARALAPTGRTGFGFSLRLDATEARHMAEWHAGLRKERPDCRAAGDHPWESAWLSGKQIPWEAEAAFPRIAWLPTASESSPPPPRGSSGAPR